MSRNRQLSSKQKYEIQRNDDLRATFDLFDKDKDGAITIKELRETLLELKLDPSNEELIDIISEFDINKSGSIYFDEFITLLNKSLKDCTDEEELESCFRVIDIENKGEITIDDMYHFLLSVGESCITRDEVKDMIKDLDTENSGKVKLDEFSEMIRLTLYDED